VRLLFVGPPGAGKGTQARRLADEHGAAHFASGDLLREAIAAGTALGVKAKEFVDRGDLVPDDVMIDLMGERIAATDDAGYVLDGFPRTQVQAEVLDGLLADMDKPLELAVQLVVPDDDIVDRLSGRRTCPTCQRAYHMRHDPPADDERCDDDGSSLERRSDDDPDTVRHRLVVYREQTEGMLDHYDRAGILVRVDGVGAPDEIAERLCKAVEAGP